MNRRLVLLLAALVLLPTLLAGSLPALAADGGKRGSDKGSSKGSGKGNGALQQSSGPTPYSQTKTLTRVFQNADGTSYEFPANNVTVDVDQTVNLRGRQRVNISWSGAQPSGGRSSKPFGYDGLRQEYPVFIVQCRGVDDPSLPVAQQVRPETCFTNSAAERSQTVRSNAEASWRADSDAPAAEKGRLSGIDPFPSAATCKNADTAGTSTHLTPFVAANGTVYPACDDTHMPPEAISAAFPPNEISAFTDVDGNGSVRFEIRSEVENESLGCSEKVACTIEVIPINGLSCEAPTPVDESADPTASASPDPTATSSDSPTAEPTTDPVQDQRDVANACRKGGQFEPGSSNFAANGVDQSVSSALWWSASNWKNRFSVPITFGLPPDTCDVLDSRPPTGFYGSELLAQAALQWAPAYCLNKKRFKFQLNQMSDAAGFALMQSGGGAAAIVSSQHKARGDEKVAYAPTAVTGFGIGYNIDLPDNAGEYTNLRLNARLIAKLITESYLGSSLGRDHPGITTNPLSLLTDPEFVALNPGLSPANVEAGATLLSLSNDSDLIEQLTDYIAQDKDAMAFVKGKPDPWGMKVNPAYKKLTLPRQSIPLLDTYVPTTNDPCRQANPQVYFSQLAAPVTTLRKISDALLDGWPNVQSRCDLDQVNRVFKLGRVDPQPYGGRFMLGIVSLGDAERFGLRTAALATSKNTFVGASSASLGTAVKLAKQPEGSGAFVLDESDLRKSSSAYPGTIVLYTAAKLSGLAQDDAKKVAQFIRISTTEGQRAGSGNGELPAGFLPITKSGVTRTLWTAAQSAAAKIEKSAATDDDDAADGSTTSDDGKAAPQSAPSGTSVLPPPASDGAPSEAPSSVAPSDAATPAETQPVAMPETASLSSGLGSTLLPLLLVIGLLGLGASAGTRFFVRPPRGDRS